MTGRVEAVGRDATKSTGTAYPISGVVKGDGAETGPDGLDGEDGLPRLALRHSPEALRWVRRQRGWAKAELAHASGLSLSTIRGLENGSRSTGPVTLAKLAEVLGCPQVVLEAGQINAVATSAASALELLERLLRISEPARLTRRRGYVRLGFVASGRHVGTLRVPEADFAELVNALRCHFPNRDGRTSARHHSIND
jgi:transcriptional regulator with XRE-family HTH domain